MAPIRHPFAATKVSLAELAGMKVQMVEGEREDNR